MSFKCDFCDKDTLKNKNMTMITGGDGIHICEECVQIAADTIASAKNKKTDQSWQETKDKLAEMADILTNRD